MGGFVLDSEGSELKRSTTIMGGISRKSVARSSYSKVESQPFERACFGRVESQTELVTTNSGIDEEPSGRFDGGFLARNTVGRRSMERRSCVGRSATGAPTLVPFPNRTASMRRGSVPTSVMRRGSLPTNAKLGRASSASGISPPKMGKSSSGRCSVFDSSGRADNCVMDPAELLEKNEPSPNSERDSQAGAYGELKQYGSEWGFTYNIAKPSIRCEPCMARILWTRLLSALLS